MVEIGSGEVVGKGKVVRCSAVSFQFRQRKSAKRAKRSAVRVRACSACGKVQSAVSAAVQQQQSFQSAKFSFCACFAFSAQAEGRRQAKAWKCHYRHMKLPVASPSLFVLPPSPRGVIIEWHEEEGKMRNASGSHHASDSSRRLSSHVQASSSTASQHFQ